MTLSWKGLKYKVTWASSVHSVACLGSFLIEYANVDDYVNLVSLCCVDFNLFK